MTLNAHDFLKSIGFTPRFFDLNERHVIITPSFPINIEFASDKITIPPHMDPFTSSHEKEPFVDDVPNDLGDEPPAGESP